MTKSHILYELPAILAFALLEAAKVREGRKLSGPSYADRELMEAIESATEEYNRHV